MKRSCLICLVGAHGDGDPDNTRTPLIAWGAGIRVQSPASNVHAHGTGHDAFSQDWGLSHMDREDVLQADIAPLMVVILSFLLMIRTCTCRLCL